ncbi:DNA-binding protein [Halobacteriales archaeon SW_10_68_16]|nr:MAG: DNA-binding protein [Halobacteriales archaeon SW_10_68_16]
MKFVEEIVVEEFLPTYRSLLAEALRERGLTQEGVAALLGISQSAVSKYVHGEVERNERLLESDRLRELVDRLADGLAEGSTTPTEALVEAEVLVRELERGGAIADLHAEAVPELAEYEDAFGIHDPDSRLRAAGQVRASVRRGLRIVENTAGFAGLIPAVGSNLVEALPGAETIEDVAGVPGRILAVRGRPTVPGEPEFGVSQHVATVLLSAREAGSDARAALNVRYDPDTVAALEAQGLTAVEFDPEADIADALSTALADTPGVQVLYQTGTMGVEPIVYVLGPDAPTVAERIRAVADG